MRAHPRQVAQAASRYLCNTTPAREICLRCASKLFEQWRIMHRNCYSWLSSIIANANANGTPRPGIHGKLSELDYFWDDDRTRLQDLRGFFPRPRFAISASLS
jgi:hypothetical protein